MQKTASIKKSKQQRQLLSATGFYALPALLAILLVLISLPGWAKERLSVPVGVAKAIQLSTQENIELPGTVLPWATTQLSAEVDGRVETLFFKEGDYVKNGQMLLQLRIHPLELQRDLALAEKNLVETRLEELKAGTRIETIEASRHSLEQAKARLDLALSELKRIKKLYKDGVLSLDEYDKADGEADQAKAALDEKKSVLEQYIAGPRIEKIKQEEANLKAAEARIKIIEDDIQLGTVYAPFDGYIIKKQAEVGQWLEKGDVALSMISGSPLKVEINLPQRLFNEIKIGDMATLVLESHDTSSKNKNYKGKVIEMVRQGDTVSRTFPVRLQVLEVSRSLAPGMLVKVRFAPKSKKEKFLFVPKDAVVRSPTGAWVWVVRADADKNMVAHKLPVKTGKLNKNRIAIHTTNGKLTPGEWVVVDGNERLKPNSPVRIINKKLN